MKSLIKFRSLLYCDCLRKPPGSTQYTFIGLNMAYYTLKEIKKGSLESNQTQGTIVHKANLSAWPYFHCQKNLHCLHMAIPKHAYSCGPNAPICARPDRAVEAWWAQNFSHVCCPPWRGLVGYTWIVIVIESCGGRFPVYMSGGSVDATDWWILSWWCCNIHTKNYMWPHTSQ